ncbi:hypothetical protein HPB52_012110 [Rhipicephalus sanguineus]|uniref:Uncharacterized protein n=1 Tax=Rhipicephalus sanguineus TaxID=34632 RepID=A0A9D4T2A2_RHISA|nr:hypothetical protein HPB52_012110 [Rhipicephalus sanguineus]
METRFACRNPDRHMMSGMGDSSDNEEVRNEFAVPEGSGSHSEMEVLKMKIKLRELELEIVREQRGSRPSSRVDRGQENHSELRHFSKLISSVPPKFPMEAEVPVWFEAAESALEGYEVPKAWWGQIIFPLVAEKISFLSTRLAPPQQRNYEVLKGAVLEEMKLLTREYLRQFHGAKKKSGRRVARVRDQVAELYLHCYVEARGVSTFEELLELFTVDQMKDGLSDAALKYVTLHEGGGQHKAHEIAALDITFQEAEGENSGVKRLERKIETMTTGPQDRAKPPVREPTKTRGRFLCGVHGHLKADCLRAENRDAAKSGSQERIWSVHAHVDDGYNCRRVRTRAHQATLPRR